MPDPPLSSLSWGRNYSLRVNLLTSFSVDSLANDYQAKLVAGAGFEPATFWL